MLNFFKKFFGKRRDAYMGPEHHDWRTMVPQNVSRLPGSDLGRRRVVRSRLPYALTFLFFVLLAVVLWFSIDEATPESKNALLRFNTDGFLNVGYVQKVLATNPQGTTREVRAIRADLEADNQVLSAQVARRADGSLDINLKERVAVARVALNAPNGGPLVIRLVSPEGLTFSGQNYPEQAIRNLPEILEFRFTGSGDQLNIDGLDIVGEFLLAARTQYPNHYKQWAAVSLRDCFGAQGSTPSSSLHVIIRPGTQPLDRPALNEIVFSTGDWRSELLLLSRLDLEGLLRKPAATAPAYVLKLSIQNRTSSQPIPEPRLVPVTTR